MITKSTENPYICFNCKHVGKCRKAILRTCDTLACENFERYKESQWIRTSFRGLSAILDMHAYILRARLRDHGWGYVVELFRAKGIEIYREKSHATDKRFKKNNYVYYMRSKTC